MQKPSHDFSLEGLPCPGEKDGCAALRREDEESYRLVVEAADLQSPAVGKLPVSVVLAE